MESSIFTSAKKFFAGTILSRILGLGRDISMAFCFGSAPEVGAFMVAYRLANLLRRLLGEGNLQGGVIPQFEHLREVGGERGASLFYRDLCWTLSLLLLVLLSFSCLVIWSIPGDIAQLTMLMAFGVIFLSLYAVASAVLQCQKSYFLPAVAPAIFNVVWIGCAFFLRSYSIQEAMTGLAWGILLAFACQWLVVAWPTTHWALQQMSWREWFSPKILSDEIQKLLKPILFGVAGIGAAQINSAFDALFARAADPSGPVYLWYAIRVQQLPLALFGIALSSALLPPLSRAASGAQWQRFSELLQSGLRRSALLLIPCSLGIIALAEPGLDLLFGRGDFTALDIARTALCLKAYAIGLVPMVFVLILANSFYARKDYQTPMRCSILAVVCNLILNALFVFILDQKEAGIALATSLSAILNCFLLWQEKVEIRRVVICALFAALFSLGVDQFLIPERNLLSQLSRLCADGIAYGGAFLGLCWLFKEKELFSILRF